MKVNNQKGFANIVFIVLAVVIVGAVGYFVVIQKPNPIIQSPFGNFTLTKIQYDDLNKFRSMRNLDCINTFNTNNREGEFVVNTEAEYQNLISYKSSYPFQCTNFVLPPIDFSQKTLLGKYASGGGCLIDFSRKVYKDDSNRRVVYIIDVIGQGVCDKIEYSINWILIPKIPSNYTVEFQVK